MAAVERKLVHKQFNSPIGLYSDQNIKETLDREIKGFGGSGIDTSDQQRQNVLANSEVLRMLQEEEEQTYTERKSRSRQRTILDRNDVLKINRIHLDRRDYSWPPSENEHIYHSPEQYIVSRYDRKRINNDHSIEFLSRNKKRMEDSTRSKSATNNSYINHNFPIISRDEFLNEVNLNENSSDVQQPIENTTEKTVKAIPKRYKSFENLNMSSKEMSNKNIPEIQVSRRSSSEIDSSKLNKTKSKSVSELPPPKPRSDKKKSTNQNNNNNNNNKNNNNNNNKNKKVNEKLILNNSEGPIPIKTDERKEEFHLGNAKAKRSTIKFQISCNELDSTTTTSNKRPILQQSFSCPLPSIDLNNNIINVDVNFKNSGNDFNYTKEKSNFHSSDSSGCENKQNLDIAQQRNYVIVTNEMNNDINNIKTKISSSKTTSAATTTTTTTSEETFNSNNENIQLTGCTTKFVDNKIQSNRRNNNNNISSTNCITNFSNTTTRSNNNISSNAINENLNINALLCTDVYVTNKNLNEISTTSLKQNFINFNQDNNKLNLNQQDSRCEITTTTLNDKNRNNEEISNRKKEIKINSIDLEDTNLQNTYQNDYQQSKIHSTDIIQIDNELPDDTDKAEQLPILIMSPIQNHINQYYNVDGSNNIINNLQPQQEIDITTTSGLNSAKTIFSGQNSIIPIPTTNNNNNNKVDEHEINFDKNLFDIKPKLYNSLSQIENMPIVENVLLDLYNVSLILGDVNDENNNNNNNKARIVDITNENFLSNNEIDINSQFDKIFDEHQILNNRPSESSNDGNQSDRSGKTTTTTTTTDKSKNDESLSESTISGTSTPEQIIIKSRNIPGGFIIRNHSPSSNNDFDIINLLFGNKEHTQNFQIDNKNKFLTDTTNKLNNSNNNVNVIHSNENNNKSNYQLKNKQNADSNNDCIRSTITTSADAAAIPSAFDDNNNYDNKLNNCNNSFDLNNSNEIYLQQLKESNEKNIYSKNQQQQEYHKNEKIIEDSSIDDNMLQEAGTGRGRLRTRYSSDNGFKTRSISQPLPYKPIDGRLQNLTFKKIDENQYYSSLPHLAERDPRYNSCNNSQEENFNKMQKLSQDHHLNVDRSTVLKINRWRRKREFQWPPLDHELRSRSNSADREGRKGLNVKQRQRWIGYKRVAWPPSSETKPFVREFTPQPQSQDGQGTYQANQSSPNQYPQQRHPQPSQQQTNPSYQSQQQPNQYPSNQTYLHPSNVQQQSRPSYQSQQQQQQPNQYPSNQPYVHPSNVQQQQHQQPQQHKQPNQYPSNQSYVHPSNIQQQPNQYQANPSPSNPHNTNYPQQQKTSPYESNLYDGPKQSAYPPQSTPSSQNSYHPQQHQQQQYNNQNVLNSNEPRPQGQTPYASQSKPQFGQQNQSQRNWSSVQGPGNRQQYQPSSNEAQHMTENDDVSCVDNRENNMGQEYTSPQPSYGQMPPQTGTSNPYYPQQQHAGVPQSYNPQQTQSQTGAVPHPYYGQQSQQNPNAQSNAYHPQHLQQTGSSYPNYSQQIAPNAYQSQQQYNQAPQQVDTSSPNLGTIKLRQETPVSQQPAPIIQSQPAARSFRGGSIMRGDLKWPPADTRDRMEAEAEHERSLAMGPQFKPRKMHKDYAPFFEKHALPHNWPGYKVPPGTQHIEAMY